MSFLFSWAALHAKSMKEQFAESFVICKRWWKNRGLPGNIMTQKLTDFA